MTLPLSLGRTVLRAAPCVDVQVDTNKDRLVSLSEFMAATTKNDFQEKDEWEVRFKDVHRR